MDPDPSLVEPLASVPTVPVNLARPEDDAIKAVDNTPVSAPVTSITNANYVDGNEVMCHQLNLDF